MRRTVLKGSLRFQGAVGVKNRYGLEKPVWETRLKRSGCDGAAKLRSRHESALVQLTT